MHTWKEITHQALERIVRPSTGDDTFCHSAETSSISSHGTSHFQVVLATLSNIRVRNSCGYFVNDFAEWHCGCNLCNYMKAGKYLRKKKSLLHKMLTNENNYVRCGSNRAVNSPDVLKKDPCQSIYHERCANHIARIGQVSRWLRRPPSPCGLN